MGADLLRANRQKTNDAQRALDARNRAYKTALAQSPSEQNGALEGLEGRCGLNDNLR